MRREKENKTSAGRMYIVNNKSRRYIYINLCQLYLLSFVSWLPCNTSFILSNLPVLFLSWCVFVFMKTAWCMSPRIFHFSRRFQHCSSEGPEGPSGFLDRLCFEMKKGYKETMLQLLLSPIHIFISDNYQVGNTGTCDVSVQSLSI